MLRCSSSSEEGSGERIVDDGKDDVRENLNWMEVMHCHRHQRD
jgi:hypothetical protein